MGGSGVGGPGGGGMGDVGGMGGGGMGGRGGVRHCGIIAHYTFLHYAIPYYVTLHCTWLGDTVTYITILYEIIILWWLAHCPAVLLYYASLWRLLCYRTY